jgi:hypothetical protein
MTWGSIGTAHVVAAIGDTEFVREHRVLLWLVGVGAVLAWLGLLGLLAAANEPRRVKPGAQTLDLVGDEPPAVVNLVVSDWVLGHEAVPATLLDLAGRKYLAIDSQGDDTLVSLTRKVPDRLADFEAMVYEHVRSLAGKTADGRVHAQALTTGPGADAEKWWKRFRAGVEARAQAMGVSRNRWSGGAKALLTTAAAAASIAVAIACLTFVTDPPPGETRDEDEDPTAIPIVAGVFTLAALGAVTARLGGQRDTPEGRVVAARWLGLGDMLGGNPTFAEQPPAGVAIWDRHIAYGAALGVSHGAVAALPLGAESETEAWSAVTGRWRVVRIRYPKRVPPGYGNHPAVVALFAAVRLAACYWLLPRTMRLGDTDISTITTDAEQARNLQTALEVAALVITVPLLVFTAFSIWRLAVGLADLVGGRRLVVGRVLRGKEVVTTRNERQVVTHNLLAVDDGTADKVRAWRQKGVPQAWPDDTVRGEVTRYLQHVRNFERVSPHAAAASAGQRDVIGPPQA